MSLRDFNAPSSADPIALHNAPSGNGAGLNSFHTRQPEDIVPSNTPKIVGAAAVALIIGVAGAALYASAGKSAQPKPVVAASNLPAPAPPAPTSLPAAAPEQTAQAAKAAKAATSDPNSLRAAMVKTPSSGSNTAPEPGTPVKTRTATAKPARTAASSAAPSDAMSARMAA